MKKLAIVLGSSVISILLSAAVIAACIFLLSPVDANPLLDLGQPEASNAEAAPDQQAVVLENETTKIDGIYLDKSYDGSEKEDGKGRLYIFATISANSGTMEVSSFSTDITAKREASSDVMSSGNAIQYDPDDGSVVERWTSYVCTNISQEVQPGKPLKIAFPFNVPDYYLNEGAEFTIDKISGESNLAAGLRFDYSSIKLAKNMKKIASEVDPKGYKAALKAHKNASSAVSKKVMSILNNRQYYSFLETIMTTYEFSGNKWTISITNLPKNGGTYTVKNGYLACKQSKTGWINWVPWKFSNKSKTEIDLDIDKSYTTK